MNRFVIIALMIAPIIFLFAACGINTDVHDVVVAEKETAEATATQLKQENTGITRLMERIIILLIKKNLMI